MTTDADVDADDLAALIRDAEVLARLVATDDLYDAPFYVVPMSRVPADLGGALPVGGWASSVADLLLRDVIGDRWQGRGLCVVVSDRRRDDVTPEVRRMAFLATVVHELAHQLRYAPESRVLADPTPEGLRAVAVASCAAMGDMAAGRAPESIISGHDATWLRVVIHAAHRAIMAGVGVSPLLAVGYPWLEPIAFDAAELLANECRAHADRPLSALRGRPIPPALADLWAHAADGYRRSVAPAAARVDGVASSQQLDGSEFMRGNNDICTMVDTTLV